MKRSAIGPAVGGEAKGDGSIVLSFLPEAADAPPPPIVKPGMRFTYHVISATIAGEGSNWVPNDKGIWENPKTGDRFDRRKKEAGGSSDTYQQYELIALDDQHSLMIKSTFMVSPNLTAPAHSGPVMYEIGSPGYGSSIWSNIDSLQSLPMVMEPNRRIVKGQWPMGNATTDAVTLFEYYPTNRCFYAYDLKTGLMIEFSIASVGPPSELTAPGETNTGSTLLVSGVAVGARPLNVPWASDPDPDWAKSFKSITYNVTSQFGLTGGAPLPPEHSKAKFEVKERGNGWVSMTKTIFDSDGPDPTLGQPAPYYTANAKIDPLWIHPSALARLQAGQVLDTDEFTKVTVRVSGTQQGPHGPYLEFVHSNGAEESKLGYDLKTGMLIALDTYNPSTFTKTSMAFAESE